jgi:hypothetical protein
LLGYISKLLGIFGERKKKRKEDAEGRVKNRESYHRKKKKEREREGKIISSLSCICRKRVHQTYGFSKNS